MNACGAERALGTLTSLHPSSDLNKGTILLMEMPHPHYICKGLEKCLEGPALPPELPPSLLFILLAMVNIY